MTIEEREKALIEVSYMDDDEDGPSKDAGPLHTQNEIINPVIQKPTITLSPDAILVHIGHIYGVIDNVIVVQGNTSGDDKVLDTGSLFVYEDREIMGEVRLMHGISGFS